MTVTVCWYYPTRRVEEKVPAAMSEAQAIEMLSGHQDFDRFIEEYRGWAPTVQTSCRP
jgi:hypothetical protein